MRSIFRRVVSFSSAALLSALVVVACSTRVGGNGDGEDGGVADDAATPRPRDMGFDPDAFWAQDPPPMVCG
jgi:hypothetical protein